MGLDSVELVMAFEDEFGICIRDEDAGKMRTPGHVADYVMNLVQTEGYSGCSSQIGFYRVRAALMNTFGLPRKAIRPDAPMQELLSGDIKENWTKLRSALQTEHLPPLQHTSALLAAIVLGAPAVVALPLLFVGTNLTTIVLACCCAVLLANALTGSMGTVVPPSCRTVGALIRYVPRPVAVRWTRKEVLAKIFDITSEQLGVPLEKIREESRFVDDLGMN